MAPAVQLLTCMIFSSSLVLSRTQFPYLERPGIALGVSIPLKPEILLIKKSQARRFSEMCPRGPPEPWLAHRVLPLELEFCFPGSGDYELRLWRGPGSSGRIPCRRGLSPWPVFLERGAFTRMLLQCDF